MINFIELFNDIFQINTNDVKLNGPCELEYVTIYNNVFKNFCSHNISSNTFSSSEIRIEYRSDRYYNDTKLEINVISNTQGNRN